MLKKISSSSLSVFSLNSLLNLASKQVEQNRVKKKKKKEAKITLLQCVSQLYVLPLKVLLTDLSQRVETGPQIVEKSHVVSQAAQRYPVQRRAPATPALVGVPEGLVIWRSCCLCPVNGVQPLGGVTKQVTRKVLNHRPHRTGPKLSPAQCDLLGAGLKAGCVWKSRPARPGKRGISIEK